MIMELFILVAFIKAFTMRNYVLIIVILLSSCLAKPKQPPLLNNEKSYFKKLEIKYKCKVEREVSVREFYPNPGDTIPERWYYIELRNSAIWKPDSMKVFAKISDRDRDKMKVFATDIAYTLHNKILQHKFTYPYIQVEFVWDIGENMQTSEGFKFPVSELERK